MENFLPFFLVLFAGVFFSTAFKRLHLPWVVALIVGGIVIGPHALNIFEINETIEFIGEIGLIFLMFMAGLETKLSSFGRIKNGVFGLALINGLVPLAVGTGIGFLLGYPLTTSVLVGIIFVSSSLAVVIPSLESTGLINMDLGRTIIAVAIVEDVLSLVMLSMFIQIINPSSNVPLPIFYILLFSILLILRWILPKIKWFFSHSISETTDLFQQELRTVLVILIGTVISFELLGLHPIIAGFFAGLVLSNSIKSQILMGKLRAISYGLFIPTFFVVVGAKTDIGVVFEADGALLVVGAIVLGSMISKFVSGVAGGRLLGFSKRQSLLIGVSKIPQLSTTLAATFTGAKLGLLDEKLVTAMVVLSIVTTFVGPIFTRSLGEKEVLVGRAKFGTGNLSSVSVRNR